MQLKLYLPVPLCARDGADESIPVMLLVLLLV
jgi:hypothetical protein